ncbi:hypothetical protein OKA04_01690 [Luteolibacter flavescens]|uniref:Uncharacterized protein n=1 Tax=Luteolibacter flavescens TaxID=1859460 RepID=A0ABT3FIN1_9BACT|nr:hypothetical protein [Luteolibacter flavescens]MCW1883421.1 hypothetical protein [Luteolibacter flavescens]
MNLRIPLFAAALLAATASLSTSVAQVECWAPGMTAPVTLTETTRSRSVSFHRPYRYDVFGIAGRLDLGNRATNAAVVGNQFYHRVLGITGGVVESTSYVRLQSGTQFYPIDLAVKSRVPATRVGPIHQYGPNWTLCDPKNPRDVGLTFHLSGSGLLGALLAPAYNNLNPIGYFYVLGEYHSAPPVMTGDVSVPSNSILYGASVPITYLIGRAPQRPVYRPPFLGLDLGDVNLAVIGSPPPPATSSSGGLINLPDIQPADLVSVTLDLSGTQGNGWLKIRRSP